MCCFKNYWFAWFSSHQRSLVLCLQIAVSLPDRKACRSCRKNCSRCSCQTAQLFLYKLKVILSKLMTKTKLKRKTLVNFDSRKLVLYKKYLFFETETRYILINIYMGDSGSCTIFISHFWLTFPKLISI